MQLINNKQIFLIMIYIISSKAIYVMKSYKKFIKEYKPDFVMNLAAESHVDKSIIGPNDFIKTIF